MQQFLWHCWGSHWVSGGQGGGWLWLWGRIWLGLVISHLEDLEELGDSQEGFDNTIIGSGDGELEGHDVDLVGLIIHCNGVTRGPGGSYFRAIHLRGSGSLVCLQEEHHWHQGWQR